MKRWVGVLWFLGVGWYIAISIILGVVLGLWLDNRLHTAPLFTLSGLFLGLVTAFWGVYRMISPLVKGEDRQNKGNG